MALDNKTATRGIYKILDKDGNVRRYLLVLAVPVPDPLGAKGVRWKTVAKRFAKYQEARDFKIKTQGEIRSEAYAAPSKLTIKEIATEWLAAQSSLKIQTRLSYATQTQKIIDALGHFKAMKLPAGAVKAAGEEWAKSLEPKTVNKLFAVLNRMFKFAEIEHEIRVNPMAKVRRLKRTVTPEAMEALEARALGRITDTGGDVAEAGVGLRAIRPEEIYTTLELRKILQAAAPGFERAFLMTAMMTGCRHGELLGLRWSVINFKTGTLVVCRSLTRVSKKNGGAILEGPKTKAGIRTLDLAPELRRELMSWRLACPPNSNDLVFVDPEGFPTSRNGNNGMLRAVCKRAGVRALSMNNLRHTFASQHLIGGAPLLEVSRAMGHSKATVTLEVYSHWIAGETSNSQSALASRIFGAVEEGNG